MVETMKKIHLELASMKVSDMSWMIRGVHGTLTVGMFDPAMLEGDVLIPDESA